MVPLPRSIMAGSTARVAATGAKKFTSNVVRKSCSVMSTRRTPGSTAALLTRRSMGPCAATIRFSAARRSSVSATSHTAVPEPDESAASGSARRASPMTMAPARARSRHSWAPRPEEAPVTTATCPA
jgi:hypothetical protein